jgi:hypothetical protein
LAKEQVQRHQSSVSIVNSIPEKVDAGSNVSLYVRVACPSKCKLIGGQVSVADNLGAIVKEIELTSFENEVNETGEFVIQVPADPGEYAWQILYGGETGKNVVHEDSSAQLSFVVKPHTTSIAVWQVPSPVEENTKFAIMVGVQCSSECNLAGQAVEIYDEKQNQLAAAALGQTPLAGTNALYWVEILIQAPGTEGSFDWTARFPKPSLELAHDHASYPFSFRTVKPPENTLTVVVIDDAQKSPIADAQVVLHPYRCLTDERGIAQMQVAKGEYELWISTNGKHRIFRTKLGISQDTQFTAELILIPDDPA